MARELNAPIEDPAATIGCGPPQSAVMAGTISWATASWNALNSHIRCPGSPSFRTSACPATLSHE